jgi:L-fuculose-phosphate aldolase
LWSTCGSDTIGEMSALAEEMCALGRRAYARQLVAGTEGNFSCRLDDERVLCTPTGVCKGLLTPADLCVIDLQANQLAGQRRRSSEMLMHVGIYAASPDVRAVIHTHPPFATTLAVVGDVDLSGFLPEGDVFLGEVPVLPYRTPGTAAMAEPLVPYVRTGVAAILQNHGAVTWGGDLESAYVLTETLEAVARTVYQARLIGTPQKIPPRERVVLAKLRDELRSAAMREGGQ